MSTIALRSKLIGRSALSASTARLIWPALPLSLANSLNYTTTSTTTSMSTRTLTSASCRKRGERVGLPSIQCRNMSLIPEAMQNISIWGGTGYLLQTFHSIGVPYWGGFVLTNILLRISLSPLVIYSAHTAARFAKVAPEIQFLVTLFQNDLKKQRQSGATFTEQRTLIFKTLQTVGGIYKLHRINPLTTFLSPLLQIPFFMYVSVDLRKIINGANPELAQQLTEGGLWWVLDLTEPDVWYALPVLGGILLYYNVESAIGQKSLTGEVASKSKGALYLKDFFQSLSIFMPCFMSQSPAGIQLYLCTSFIFTYFQGQALRNDTCRQMVGLPERKGATKMDAKLANEFIALKKLENEARKARGDGPLLGTGVLANGLEVSFAGRKRPSSIQGSGIVPEELLQIDTKKPHVTIAPPMPVGNAPFIHGISAPAADFDIPAEQIPDTKKVGDASLKFKRFQKKLSKGMKTARKKK